MSAPYLRQSGPSQVRRPLLRRAFLLALIPAVVLAGRIAKSDIARVPTADGGEWTITISPAIEQHVVAEVAGISTEATAHLTKPVQMAQLAPSPEPRSDRQAPAASARQPAVPVEVSENGVHVVPNPISVPQTIAYRKIYDSIPFRRAEYLANPSYRHETTMELFTGNQRQVVVHRNYTPKLHEPTARYPLFFYNRNDGYYGDGGMGYGGLGSYGLGYGFNNTPGYPPAFRYFMPVEDVY